MYDTAPVFYYNIDMTINEFSIELYNLYGSVTRARNCFLYTKKGVRITDLFQENGRAILGWEGGNAFTHLKNTLSRGLTGSFICEDVSRVAKAVSELLNSDRQIFYFSNKMDAVKASVSISQSNSCIYKPWNPNIPSWSEIDTVIIEPPLPWTNTVYILAVNLKAPKPISIATPGGVAIPSPFANAGLAGIETPESAISIPYALEVAIARSIYNLLNAINTRQEKDWFIYDSVLTKYFTRTGPYLTPKVPKNKYDDFVRHCLKLGIAINPHYNENSIVPFGADKGVFTKLKNSPFNY